MRTVLRGDHVACGREGRGGEGGGVGTEGGWRRRGRLVLVAIVEYPALMWSDYWH